MSVRNVLAVQRQQVFYTTKRRNGNMQRIHGRRTAKYLKQVFCKRGWLGSNHEERVVNPQKLGYWGFVARKLATQPHPCRLRA